MIEKNEFLFQLWLLQLVSVCRGRFTECLVFFFKVILAFFAICFFKSTLDQKLGQLLSRSSVFEIF